MHLSPIYPRHCLAQTFLKFGLIESGIYSASNADSCNRICRLLFSEIPILFVEPQHKESRSLIKMISAVSWAEFQPELSAAVTEQPKP
jgi:hypothetical protein